MYFNAFIFVIITSLRWYFCYFCLATFPFNRLQIFPLRLFLLTYSSYMFDFKVCVTLHLIKYFMLSETVQSWMFNLYIIFLNKYPTLNKTAFFHFSVLVLVHSKNSTTHYKNVTDHFKCPTVRKKNKRHPMDISALI